MEVEGLIGERGSKSKFLRFGIQTVIGLVILIAIYFKVRDYNLSAFSTLSYPFFFLSVFFYFMLNLSLAFRLKKVVESTGCSVSFRNAVTAHLGGMILSDLTPGRSGYLSTPFFLKKISGCELNRGMAGILVPQAIEFLVKILGAFLGLLLLANVTARFKEILGMSALAMALLFGVSALIILGSWSGFATRIPLPNFIKRRLEGYSEQSMKTKSTIGIILPLTLLGWLLTAFQWYFVGLSLSLPLDFFHYLLLQPLITLLMFVPLTPAGLGIMEGGAVAILFLLGIDPSIGFVYSILVRLSTLLADSPGLLPVAKSFRPQSR